MYEQDSYASSIRELGKKYQIHEIGLKDYEDGQPLPEDVFSFLKEARVFENLSPGNSAVGVQSVSRWLTALREVGALDNTSVHIMTTQSLIIYALQFAGETQRLGRQLQEMLELDKHACFCLTEAGGGSDAAGMQTTAFREQDGYRIRGEKCMIMNAGFADYFLVAARLSDVEGYDGITLFLVDRDTPGLTVFPHTQTCGVTGVPINRIAFSDVRVPQERLVGQEGKGWKILMKVLNCTRPGVGAAALGATRTAMERAAVYGKDRVCFGKPLNKNAVLQGKFAEMTLAWESGWLMVERAGRYLDEGRSGQTAISAMAKIAATDAAKLVVDRSLDFFGGYGYLKEVGMERFYRDVRVCTIYDGTNDILRGLVAGSQLKSCVEHA
ncbi:acyl-CoA dehydrogenase family protein [Dysosmobacter sp. Phy]